MKTKNTKKRFVLSLVAVIACVAMLVGTTMAWFTDAMHAPFYKFLIIN